MSNLKLKAVTFQEMLDKNSDQFLIGPETLVTKAYFKLDFGWGKTPVFRVSHWSTEIAVLLKDAAIFHYGSYNSYTTRARLNQLMASYNARCFSKQHNMHFSLGDITCPWLMNRSVAILEGGKENPLFRFWKKLDLSLPPGTALKYLERMVIAHAVAQSLSSPQLDQPRTQVSP